MIIRKSAVIIALAAVTMFLNAANAVTQALVGNYALGFSCLLTTLVCTGWILAQLTIRNLSDTL